MVWLADRVRPAATAVPTTHRSVEVAFVLAQTVESGVDLLGVRALFVFEVFEAVLVDDSVDFTGRTGFVLARFLVADPNQLGACAPDKNMY